MGGKAAEEELTRPGAAFDLGGQLEIFDLEVHYIGFGV